MALQPGDVDREKVVSKLPGWLHRSLKVRAAELGVDIQDAVASGIRTWRATSAVAEVDTAGADPFSTWLPAGVYDEFRQDCAARGVSYIQGLAQSVTLWLENHPSGDGAVTRIPPRKIVCNQKGGVGKTTVSAGISEALAESGLRVLLVDYDPQGHLSRHLGVTQIVAGEDSLARHMSGEAKGDIQDLIVTLSSGRFGGRLHVLPACTDAFLLDVMLSRVRGRERALERAMAPVENDYDVIVLDCPPSLGLSVDAALYYGRQRDGEPSGSSGVLIPVQAEDTSADAFNMLMSQISDLCADVSIEVACLGLVVNLYDARRGYIATSSLEHWRSLGTPPVVAVIHDLKEQREAGRLHQALLDYAPTSSQADIMRQLAREI